MEDFLWRDPFEILSKCVLYGLLPREPFLRKSDPPQHPSLRHGAPYKPVPTYDTQYTQPADQLQCGRPGDSAQFHHTSWPSTSDKHHHRIDVPQAVHCNFQIQQEAPSGSHKGSSRSSPRNYWLFGCPLLTSLEIFLAPPADFSLILSPRPTHNETKPIRVAVKMKGRIAQIVSA